MFPERANITLCKVDVARAHRDPHLGARRGPDQGLRLGGLRRRGRGRAPQAHRPQGPGHAAGRRAADRMARQRRPRADDRPGRARVRGPIRSGAVRQGRRAHERRGRHLRLPAQRRRVGGDPPPGALPASTDAVVVNTCAVTGEAVRQARQAIRKLRRERPRRADRRHRLRGADRRRRRSPPCRRSIACSATRRSCPPRPGRADRSERIAVGDIMAATHATRAPRSTASRAAPAPSCRCRTAATTAARSASSRSAAAIRARCRSTTWWRRRASWPRTAMARSC